MSDAQPENMALAYARALHGELAATNKDLYVRAQAVLTLDGLMITVFGAIISAAPGDVTTFARNLTFATAAFGLLTLGALAVSVVCAVIALSVFYRSGISEPEVRPVSPAHMSFYARIAEIHPPADFVAAGMAVSSESEARIRLEQVVVMAPLMLRRARLVNAAYWGAAVALLSLLAGAISYLVLLSQAG